MKEITSSSVADAFQRTAQQWPDRPCLNVLPETAQIYGIEAGAISYSTALQQIQTLSDQFQTAGYTRGHRVLLLLENRPQFFIYWLALNRIGVSVVPVNPDLRQRELEYLIAHAEPALAITIGAHKTPLKSAARNVGSHLPVVLANEAILPNAKAAVVTSIGNDTAANEAALLYTSGTTGNPKGCVLSNNYFLLAGHWYATTGGLCSLTTEGEHMITPLPVFHMNAMAYSFMAMVTVGGCLTCLDRFHPRSWWSSVKTSKATCLHYLGVMPSMLMGMDNSQVDRDHNVRFGFGAGIDRTLHQPFEHRFGFPLVEAWAMTETGAGVVIAANHEPRQVGFSCFGRPDKDIEIMLVDDNDKEVAADTPGELRVRRAGNDPRFGLFTEYYKDPEATAAAWKDGWFHTGDMVRQDADGNMIFVDRKKNVIRRSGENIAAVEVESVLMQHPAITAVGITAVPDTVRGDEVFACISVHHSPGEQLARDIVDWCLTQISYYKAPGYIAFVDALPLTSTQKIQRGELKAEAQRLLKEPATICTVDMKRRQTA